MAFSPSHGGAWGYLPMQRDQPRLFRRLPDGTFRPIAAVPGGPPTAMGTVQPDEMIVIDTPGGQVEVMVMDYGDTLVRVCGPGTHPV